MLLSNVPDDDHSFVFDFNGTSASSGLLKDWQRNSILTDKVQTELLLSISVG